MKMTYRSGRSDEDDLFDQTDDAQIAYVARCLGHDPNRPSDWPIEVIKNLIAIRRLDGKQKFYREIGRMMSP